eukprot:scaffold712_cov404-Prasinococcus_capsulatus_cf.AAC.3
MAHPATMASKMKDPSSSRAPPDAHLLRRCASSPPSPAPRRQRPCRARDRSSSRRVPGSTRSRRRWCGRCWRRRASRPGRSRPALAPRKRPWSTSSARGSRHRRCYPGSWRLQSARSSSRPRQADGGDNLPSMRELCPGAARRTGVVEHGGALCLAGALVLQADGDGLPNVRARDLRPHVRGEGR